MWASVLQSSRSEIIGRRSRGREAAEASRHGILDMADHEVVLGGHPAQCHGRILTSESSKRQLCGNEYMYSTVLLVGVGHPLADHESVLLLPVAPLVQVDVIRSSA